MDTYIHMTYMYICIHVFMYMCVYIYRWGSTCPNAAAVCAPKDLHELEVPVSTQEKCKQVRVWCFVYMCVCMCV